MKTLLLLDETDVQALLTLEEAMKAVRTALVAQANKVGQLFPVVKEKFSANGSFSLKSGVMLGPDVLGVKAAGSWRSNPEHGLPTVQATVVLVDPETGEPLAIIAGKTLTTLRTGAAGGVAASALARQNSTVLAVIGSGVQGQIQTEGALLACPGIKEIRVCSAPLPVTPAFFVKFESRAKITMCASPSETVQGADIIITATPSNAPLIDLADVKPGAHINAVGTDAKGKREIGVALLQNAARFVDSAEQARSIGEHQHAPELSVTEIGAVLDGKSNWQRVDGEITLFDSTGVAFQDLSAAKAVYDLAIASGRGRRIDWPT